jgi:hypothetical protein
VTFFVGRFVAVCGDWPKLASERPILDLDFLAKLRVGRSAWALA